MVDKIDISELHGTVIRCKASEDDGFNEQVNSDELIDDVFYSEDKGKNLPSLLPLIDENGQEPCSSKDRNAFIRRRKETSLSSGYVSDVTISLTTPESNPKLKEIRDVYSQTDFPLEEDEEEEEQINTPPPTVAASPRPHLPTDTTVRQFCWKHDNVYDTISQPAARPPSASSDDVSTKRKAAHIERLSIDNRTCPKCIEMKKKDLRSRKEAVKLSKETIQPSIAKIKNCSSNILSTEIERCSNLWTENRTFYLGTETMRQSRRIKRENTISLPTLGRGSAAYQKLFLKQNIKWTCIHCTGSDSDTEVIHRPCSRHLFWIRSLSLSRENTPRKDNENFKRPRRDWILVQCVQKFLPKSRSLFDSGYKLSYRTYGEQEMLLCPALLRSIEYIEDICCQHFIRMSRDEAIQNNRKLELLYSPKGPMLREDKHLEGLSIFYFCCDLPFDFSSIYDKTETEITLPSLPTATKPKLRRKSCSSISSVCSADSSKHNSNTTSTFSHRLKTSTLSSCFKPSTCSSLSSDSLLLIATNRWRRDISNKQEQESTDLALNFRQERAAILEESVKDLPRKFCEAWLNKKGKRKLSKAKIEEVEENESEMKKSVTFAECIDENSQKNANKNDLIKRRASLPPPPPKFIEDSDTDYERRRKRRESVAISFGAAPNEKQEVPAEPAKVSRAPVQAYEAPKWKSVKLVITFKEKKFSAEFLEYKTLEDTYAWVRQKLLEYDMLTPGADLLLSHGNLKFPLKANTANSTVISLPFTDLLCEELKQSGRKGGFGDGNSRFDTRFALPVDMRLLEGISPAQYLQKYCLVSSTWKSFYYNIFNQNDGNKDGINTCMFLRSNGWSFKDKEQIRKAIILQKISYDELKGAMERLFVELAHPLLKRVLFLMGYDPLSKFSSNKQFNFENKYDQTKKYRSDKKETWHEQLSIDKDTFVSMCALGNRIICRENEIDGYPVDTIKQSGTQLEDADFYDIDGKMRNCTLNPLTKRLLLYVKK